MDEDTKFYITGGVLGLVSLFIIIGMIVIACWIKHLSAKIDSLSQTQSKTQNFDPTSYNSPEAPQPIAEATDKYLDYKIRRAQMKNEEDDAVPSWMKNEPPRKTQSIIGQQNVNNNNWSGNEQHRPQPTALHGYSNLGGNANRYPMSQQMDRPTGRQAPQHYDEGNQRFGRY